MLFEKQQKILFIGDSITDSGRRDVAIPYGNGFVNTVRNYLIARYPELGLNIVNKGIAGNTLRDLAARWDRDVIAEHPNWVCVCVGINDVWRQFAGPVEGAVFPEEYQVTYRRLLQQTRVAIDPRYVLITPYIIEPDRTLPMRLQIDAYVKIVQAMAKDFNAPLVNLQAAWDNTMRVSPPILWTNDQFHPSGPGSSLIAHEFLKTIGFTL